MASKHLHDRITSLRGEIWGDRTVLSAPLPVTSQKSEWSYICVLSEILIFDFEIVPTLWYFCQFITSIRYKTLRRVLRYQRDNQNLYMIEEQTTQWPKEKGQKDKQRSTKHAQVTQPPLKTGGELRYSGRVSSSCSNSGTRRFNIVTNPVIFHE